MATVDDASSPPHPLVPGRQPGTWTVADARFPPHLLGGHPGASAMAASSRRPFPIYVVNHVVDTGDLTSKPEPGPGWPWSWSEIPCASRMAYGCGENIQKALEGLTLYVSLGDAPHLSSALAIRMSEDAIRRFESELDPDYFRLRRLRLREQDAKLPSNLTARGHVKMAEEQGVTVILLSFTRPAAFYQQPQLLYYLAYDDIGRSLSMFQILPEPCKGVYDGVCTFKPVVPKRTNGSSDYELLVLAQDRSSSSHKYVLWVGSLSPSDGTGVPSKLKSMEFPKRLIHKPFEVDMAFSCQGKAFWGDLKQGLLYCDLQHTSGGFGFVKLPRVYKDDVQNDDVSRMPIRRTRTIGRVGDSVWFVCIDMPSHYTNDVVCIWELVLPEKGNGKGKAVHWKEVVEEVPAKMLWEAFSFKKTGLPAAPFQYPILTPDGALCFVLVDQRLFVEHFCIFDIRCKSVLWHGVVHNYRIFETVIMCPSSSFLDMKQCSYLRNSAED